MVWVVWVRRGRRVVQVRDTYRPDEVENGNPLVRARGREPIKPHSGELHLMSMMLNTYFEARTWCFGLRC